MLLKPLGHLSVDAPYSPTLLFRSKPALLKRVFQGYRFFVVRTGFEPVLLVITLFTNHPYLGPSTIPTPDYFVIPTGFEPVTYCLEGSCSIQLSYEIMWSHLTDSNRRPSDYKSEALPTELRGQI